MISSQNHPLPDQDHPVVTTTGSYSTDPITTGIIEPMQQQPQQLSQNEDHSMTSQNEDHSMMLLRTMREQIEFYFSSNNYIRDVFLQQVVTAHHGSVPIAMIAQFPKIQQLYFGMMQYYYMNHPTFVAPIEVMVYRALAQSRLIEVSNDGYYLRPIWSLLMQDRDDSSHDRHVPPMEPLHNSDQTQIVKLSGTNHHTDSTNTTVSPTSFASGSDGSIGPQSTGGSGDAAAAAAVVTNTITNTKPQSEPVPVLFNPTGGVYYTQPPPQQQQAFHYPVVFAPTTYHQPYPAPRGVVASFNHNIYPSYPTDNNNSYYRPNSEPNLQFFMPQQQQLQQQYAPPPPPPSSYAQYFPHPTPPSVTQQYGSAHPTTVHSNTYQDYPATTITTTSTSNEYYSKVPSPSVPFPISTQIVNQPSMPSPASINAPPSVIRLQDPFHDDVIYSHSANQNRNNNNNQQRGNRKKSKGGKNKGRTSASLNRQASSSSANRNGTGPFGSNGHEAKQSTMIPNVAQEEEVEKSTIIGVAVECISDDGIPISNAKITNTTANASNNDDGDESSRISIPKKENDRISATNQNRTSSVRHQSNRSVATSSSSSQTRTSHQQQDRSTGSNRAGGTKHRFNSNKKTETLDTASSADHEREAIILIDENFPCLTKVPNHLVATKVEHHKMMAMEDCNKKKYAEALLHNPVISKYGSTQSPIVVTGSTTTNETSCVGDMNNDVPAVTNLLGKFNLNE